jgi:hypothetical protein
MPFFVIAAMPEGFGDDAMQLGPGAGLQRPGVPFAVHEDAAAELKNHPYLVEVDRTNHFLKTLPMRSQKTRLLERLSLTQRERNLCPQQIPSNNLAD